MNKPSDENIFRGRISFVNYEKNFATIEYFQGTKEKSVNFRTDTAANNKKPHQFMLGDAVAFKLKLSDRGDKMTAYEVQFTHNEGIDLLLQQAEKENRFSGYLKKIDDQYFIKEVSTYILFRLQLSPWEKPPADTADNAIIFFKLINLDKPKAIAAELFSHQYIPAYLQAKDFFASQKPIEATVKKISPFAVYLELFPGSIESKLPLNEFDNELKEGDKVRVIIAHLSGNRIIIKRFED